MKRSTKRILEHRGSKRETHNVNWETLRKQCQNLMVSLDVPENEAWTVGDNLVDVELCGVESHGVNRMSIYMKRLKCGVVNIKSESVIVQEYPSSIHWNGCNSMGMVTGVNAMQRCIEKARETGCCFVAVNHSNHYGMAS